LAVVAAFFAARQKRICGSSSSGGRQDECPALLLGELLAAVPYDLLHPESQYGMQRTSAGAAALLSYLQQHSGVFKIRPSNDAPSGTRGFRYEDELAAAGASATWQVQLQQAAALQLLTLHDLWAGLLPAVEAELLALMKPRNEDFPLVPRVPLGLAVRQLREVLPQLQPYLQLRGVLEAAVAAAPLSYMFGLSCGAAHQTPAAAEAAAEGVPNSSSSFTHIELRPSARLAAWADGVRTCPNWQGGCPQGVLCNQSHLQPAQWLSSSQQQQRR
jgi:hypothetical protein